MLYLIREETMMHTSSSISQLFEFPFFMDLPPSVIAIITAGSKIKGLRP